MKVVAINGSPRKDGNCAQMLEVLGKVLEQEGIEFEVCQPGAKVHPCMACYHCLDNGTLRCVQDDDGVNEIIAKCIEVSASPTARRTPFLRSVCPPNGSHRPRSGCHAIAPTVKSRRARSSQMSVTKRTPSGCRPSE